MQTLFPETLTRLQYLVRFLIFMVAFVVVSMLLYFGFKAVGLADSVFPLIVIALVLMRFPCLDIPRLRNMGWSPWLSLLILIPIINLIFQLALFTMPPEDANRQALL
jgi:uncharacterized membrane protein YhaH (DUF805 family)